MVTLPLLRWAAHGGNAHGVHMTVPTHTYDGSTAHRESVQRWVPAVRTLTPVTLRPRWMDGRAPPARHKNTFSH